MSFICEAYKISNVENTNNEVLKMFTKKEIKDIAASSTLKMIYSGEDQSSYLYLALGSNFRETRFNEYIYKFIVPESIVCLFAKLMQYSRIQAEVFLNKFFLEGINICKVHQL
ncbi:uncharacterized protein LOC136084705 isoform X2 [Hydra vulgaris]|uniref:Uncharacterized protein LOC136084705 isoform X2 n=1 Tax=Hydra vulgaris TaxID=6087 RepID=A0ABM4CI33_HYDVU